MHEIDACLIYLPKPYLKQPDAQQPLGLMYLASSALNAGRSVVIRNYSTFSRDEIAADLPASLFYGITATSMEIPEANRIAKIIRSKFPNSKIAIGGPGAYSNEYISDDFNVIVQGDGEDVINEIMADTSYYFSHKTIVRADDVDVDKLPFPARDLLECQGGNIFAYDKNYSPGGSTIILSSRGCPYNCAFCSAPQLTGSRRVRFRKPEDIRAEIMHVMEKHKIFQYRFSDDMFTASKKHVMGVCDAIGDLGISWRVSCRVNPLDKEMLNAMRDAGCRELSFGIESFDDVVLAGLNKRANCQDNVKALHMAQEAGFKTRILFMIGTPYQTPETIRINKHYILNRVPYDIIACTQFIPIPGCGVWNDPDKYGVEILDRDLENYNFYMFGPEGRRDMTPIIKIKDRPLNEFLKESEDFRDWIEDIGKVNKG